MHFSCLNSLKLVMTLVTYAAFQSIPFTLASIYFSSIRSTAIVYIPRDSGVPFLCVVHTINNNHAYSLCIFFFFYYYYFVVFKKMFSLQQTGNNNKIIKIIHEVT